MDVRTFVAVFDIALVVLPDIVEERPAKVGVALRQRTQERRGRLVLFLLTFCMLRSRARLMITSLHLHRRMSVVNEYRFTMPRDLLAAMRHRSRHSCP